MVQDLTKKSRTHCSRIVRPCMGASTCMGIYLYMRRAFVFQSQHCTAHREIFFPVSLIYSGTYRCNRPALYLHAPPYAYTYKHRANGEEHIYGVTAFIIAYICMQWNRTNSYRPKNSDYIYQNFQDPPISFMSSSFLPFEQQNLARASWPENILLNLWSLLLHWGTDYQCQHGIRKGLASWPLTIDR